VTATAEPAPALVADPRQRRLLGLELVLVLLVSLAKSGAFALVSLLDSLSRPQPLAAQNAVLNGSGATSSLLDLTYQLLVSGFRVVPVLLVVFLVLRGGERLADIGVRAPGRLDAVRGAVLAVVVGGAGLAVYLGARAFGSNLTVVPTTLPAVWWRIPVLVLSAVTNGVLEEVVVVGYLVRRLDQRGWGDARTTVASALLRGSYHLYQGFGGFLGNAVMGLLFVRLRRRWGSVVPLVVAHSLIDTVAFVGYVVLVGHVSWLPGPA